MPSISIIVPIYNSEENLGRCLNSISNQAFTDFEVLLINDGSTDKSGEICEEYSKKDCRFHVFHQSNKGVSAARNLGLENVNGKWFTFVDSDDILYPNALSTYVSHVSDDIDLVSEYYNKIDNDGNLLQCVPQKISKKIKYEDALIDQYRPLAGMFNGYLWTRMFRTSVMTKHKLRFNEQIYIKEDGLFIVEFICKSLRDVFIDTETVYGYIQNESSVMRGLQHHYNPKYITDLDACILCYKRIKQVSSNKELHSLAKNLIFYIHWVVGVHYRRYKKYSPRLWFTLFYKTIKGTSIGFVLKSYYHLIIKRIKNRICSKKNA